MKHTFTVGLVLTLLGGCAQWPVNHSVPQSSPPIVAATAVTPVSGAACQTLVGKSDQEAARALDLAPLMLETLKEYGRTDNLGVCAMPEAQRTQHMLAYRNSFRNPTRAKSRPAALDYMRTWDVGENGQRPTSTQVLAAENARKVLIAESESRAKAAGINQARWTAIGPGNVGGRLRAVLIDPRDPNKIFVGAASGGIWRSTDGGRSYAAVADFLGSIAIGAMAFDPNNPNVMYAGTGENYQSLLGVGMFKSTDGGLTWNFLASTNNDTAVNPLGDDWGYVNRIAVSKTNSNIVLAATSRASNRQNGAIFRSTDAGNTWTRVYTSKGFDMQMDPFDSNKLVVGSNDGFMVTSVDAGLTWQRNATPLVTTFTGSNSSARAEVAYAPSQRNLLYVSLDNNSGDVWKSEDGGQNWTFLSNPKHLSSQGWYDNTIWVDPFDANHVIVGGIDLWRSTDGGLNFTRISTWQSAGPGLPQPHADHHVIIHAPNYSATNRVVYFGTDGGLYRSSNIALAGPNGTTTWENLNNGLAVTQFYGGAGLRSAGGAIIGGTQDNGTLRLSTGTDWIRFAGGDGGYVAVDPVSDQTLYGEYVYASIRRTVNGVGRYICNGITEAKKDEGGIVYCGANATERTNFISPFILDPNVRSRMLVGADSLWVSDDVRTPTNPSWRAIKPPATASSTSHFIRAVDVARGNSDLIWVGHNAPGGSAPSHIYKSTDGTSATPTWTNMAQAGMPTTHVNRVTIDHENHNRVWVAYDGFSPNRLWVTEDGGTTWRNISSGLPQVSLHDVKRHPTDRNLLYVAAANGIYTSENAGATWNAVNDGPNSVRVRELFWYDNQTLVAATFGRGMFSVDVAPNTLPGAVQFTASTQRAAEGATITVSVSRTGGVRGAASVNYSTGGGTATPGADYVATNGTLTWADGDGTTKSFTIRLLNDTLAEPAETFIITLAGASGAALGATTTHTVTITDPDVFPVGCVMPAGFTVPAGAATGWGVATDSSSEGACSLKSNPTPDASAARIAFTGTFRAGNVTFTRRVSSEATFDCFRFTIDGVQQNVGGSCPGAVPAGIGASGEVAWGPISVPITAGVRTLVWSFEKDADTIGGQDAAWIDELVLPLAGPAADYSDMWWAGEAENGWGMSIQQHSNGVQFNALYVYDAAGQPRWYVMPGGTWNSNFTSYTGAVYQPTSAPLNNYTNASFVPGASPGSVTLNFLTPSTATLNYTINGVTGSKSIQRQSFSAGTAPFNVADLWWAGGNQDGWGINLAQQGGTIFAVWYTYGLDGKAYWLVMPGGSWSGNTYSGTLFATTGSPWLGATYNPAQLAVTQVGTVSLAFSSATAATMNYSFTAGPFAGTTQSKTLVRQPF